LFLDAFLLVTVFDFDRALFSLAFVGQFNL